MSLDADSTVRDLMARGKTSICGQRIEFAVDDLTDAEFDALYDLMDAIYPVEDAILKVPE